MTATLARCASFTCCFRKTLNCCSTRQQFLQEDFDWPTDPCQAGPMICLLVQHTWALHSLFVLEMQSLFERTVITSPLEKWTLFLGEGNSGLNESTWATFFAHFAFGFGVAMPHACLPHLQMATAAIEEAAPESFAKSKHTQENCWAKDFHVSRNFFTGSKDGFFECLEWFENFFHALLWAIQFQLLTSCHPWQKEIELSFFCDLMETWLSHEEVLDNTKKTATTQTAKLFDTWFVNLLFFVWHQPTKKIRWNLDFFLCVKQLQKFAENNFMMEPWSFLGQHESTASQVGVAWWDFIWMSFRALFFEVTMWCQQTVPTLCAAWIQKCCGAIVWTVASQCSCCHQCSTAFWHRTMC